MVGSDGRSVALRRRAAVALVLLLVAVGLSGCSPEVTSVYLVSTDLSRPVVAYTAVPGGGGVQVDDHVVPVIGRTPVGDMPERDEPPKARWLVVADRRTGEPLL